MATEITWGFIIYKAGQPVQSGVMSSIDLSYPARQLELLAAANRPCTIKVRDSEGHVHEKSWE